MRPTAVAFVAVAVLILASLIAGPQRPAEAGVNVWDSPVTISASGESASLAQVVSDGSIITAVWQRAEGSYTRVQASSSGDGGTTWNAAVNLSAPGQIASNAQLVTDGSTITAVWDRFDGSNNRVQASSSVDGGASWSTPVDLSAAGQDGLRQQVVTDGSTITVVWDRFDGSNTRVQASSSVDNGATWSTPVDLSAAGQNTYFPQLVTDGNTITAVWNRFDGMTDRVQASSSADGGTTWSTPVDLSAAGGYARPPQVVTDGRIVTAMWSRFDGSQNRIQASASANRGITWSTPVDLSDAGQSAYDPQLVTDGLTITAVWSRSDGSHERVQASSSLNSGIAWSTPVDLSEDGQNAYEPQLVTDGRTITAVWFRSDGTKNRIQTSSSANQGATWSAPLDLSTSAQNSDRPQLVRDGSTATAVWLGLDGSNDRVHVSSFTSPRQPSRLAGSDRYATGVEISKQFAANVPVVYLAAGTNFPDALSASSAATVLGGPLLLTTPTSIPAVVATELQRLNPDEVVIAGGTSAVSEAVRDQVAALLPSAVVRRDSGDSRYATSRALASNAFTTAPTVFLATGANFPDALSASAAAGVAGAPVILIDGGATDIDEPTRDLFTELGTTDVIIAGGTGAVRAEIQTALNTLFGPTNVTRLSGSDRYATGVAINQSRFVVAPTVFLATGTGFADALAGAALAGRDKGPLYVVPGSCVPPTVLTELSRLKVNRVTLFGGTTVLTPTVQTLTPC